MSTGTRVSLEEATRVARDLRGRLQPGCQRIEIAGSIRRGRADVGDIELVAEPILLVEENILGEPIGASSSLDGWIRMCRDHGILADHPDDPKDGERYKKLLHPPSGLQVDLFIVRPPASFGVVWLIRTGPARYSQWLVTHARRTGHHVASGSLHMGSIGFGDACTAGCQVVPTPDEFSVYEALGLPFQQPEDRVA